MLRHLDGHRGGVFTYTTELLGRLVDLAPDDEFVLFTAGADAIRFLPRRPNVSVVQLDAFNRFVWDQWAVRRAVSRHRIDVLFNPKYSLPLFLGKLGIFVCHGLDWYLFPAASRWFDRLNHHHLIPMFARAASRVICVTDTVAGEFCTAFAMPRSRVKTVHHGVSHVFFESSRERMLKTKQRHALPDRFVLYVGQIYPPKNMKSILDAHALYAQRHDIPLVIAGEHRWLSDREMASIRSKERAGKVLELGWVEKDELAALYRLAEMLVFPSFYEGFGMPVIEAMASGCPVVTSDRHATAEIGGDAALLVDPNDHRQIADAMIRISDDARLRRDLVTRGRKRARQFSWDRCARETLAVIRSVGSRRPDRVDEPVAELVADEV